MDYNKIVSVKGLSGLYELVTAKSDGAIVRSLEDNSTKFISARQHNYVQLESVEIYTTKENASLSDVFSAIKKSEDPLPEANDSKALKAYFEKTYPDLDFERVYASDMKKMITWYQILQKNDVEIKEPETDISTDAPGNVKPAHKETPHVKDMKPQKAAPRKIESRGVK